MFNNMNNENIITKSQMYERIQPNKILGDSFAKTINYYGIHNNFSLDIPEILEEERKIQERKNDIAKFTKLATSDIENTSHSDRMKELLSDKSFRDEYEKQALASLASNSQFLNDLGLL